MPTFCLRQAAHAFTFRVIDGQTTGSASDRMVAALCVRCRGPWDLADRGSDEPSVRLGVGGWFSAG